jgi:hypothetical protein
MLFRYNGIIEVTGATSLGSGNKDDAPRQIRLLLSVFRKAWNNAFAGVAIETDLAAMECTRVQRAQPMRNMYIWVIIHWFELGTLVLLCLNLWFVSSVLHALRETNRWLVFLSRVRWDETHGPGDPN